MSEKRDWLFVGCEAGHDYVSMGGCNAGCHHDCACSVPVHQCSRCGDCDYGDNREATDIRRECIDLRGTMDERIAAFEAERAAVYQQEKVSS